MFSLSYIFKSIDTMILNKYIKLFDILIKTKLKIIFNVDKPYSFKKYKKISFKTSKVLLPSKIKKYTVTRSPFIYKKSQEHFGEIQTKGILKISSFLFFTTYTLDKLRDFFNLFNKILPNSIHSILKLQIKNS